MFLKQIKESGIPYKPADFKAEVHFLGQIVGASNLVDNDCVFVEAFLEIGEQWKSLSKQSNIQTQSCYVDENRFACFTQPFDLHFATENLFGWPRMIARLWKLDETNKVDLISYGSTVLPNTSGFHEIEFESWSLKGTYSQEILGFFLESKPLMNISDPVTSYLDNRNFLISKPGPKIHMNVEVILRNFSFHSLSGTNTEIDI